MDASFLCQLESAVLCKFSKGQYLAQQDDPLKYIYYLVEGCCERVDFTEDGGEILFNIKPADHSLNAIVGLHTLWTADFRYTNSFIAVTDVTCYRIDAMTAKQEILKYPEILDAIIASLNQKYLTLRDMYTSRQTRRIPNQICALLANHVITIDNVHMLSPQMTNVNISHQLNVHPVTVAKIMSFLQREHVILRTKNNVQILDLPQLQKYAGNMRVPYLSK